MANTSIKVFLTLLKSNKEWQMVVYIGPSVCQE